MKHDCEKFKSELYAMDYNAELPDLQVPDCLDCQQEVTVIKRMRQSLDKPDYRVTPAQLSELMEAAVSRPERSSLYLKLSIVSLIIIVVISLIIISKHDPEIVEHKIGKSPELVELPKFKDPKVKRESKSTRIVELRKKLNAYKKKNLAKNKSRKTDYLSKRFIKLNSKLKNFKKTERKRRMT